MVAFVVSTSVILILLIYDSVCNPTLPYHTLQVFGNASLGYYYVNLHYGTPPQPQSVIVDTGSSLLTTPCTKCRECGSHLNAYFDISKSKTCKILSCGSGAQVCKQHCSGNFAPTDTCVFKSLYSQGSQYEGIFLQDFVQLEGNSEQEGVKMEFGCTTKQTNLFFSQKANGILGLSPNRTLIFEKLVKAHQKFTGEKMQFSLCLSSNGGYLNIGGSNSSYHQQKPKSLKFNSYKKLYSIENVQTFKIQDHYFHNENLGVGDYGVFIDSGSTISYLPKLQYNSLIRYLDALCKSFQNCHQYPKSTVMHSYQFIGNKINQQFSLTQFEKLLLKVFPPLIFKANDEQFQWSPLQYFFLRDPQNLVFSLGIQQKDRFILGSNWLVNKDVIFNLEKNLIIIYPESKCKQPQILIKEKHTISIFLFPHLLKKDVKTQIKTISQANNGQEKNKNN